MAGAGYKLFNTGDVLTAAQVNTYLNEQTVMVFASAAARTTALSGVLAEGMISYLQDINTVQFYDGSSWGNVGTQLTFNAQTGTTYTLVATDVDKLVTLSNASAITLTVPPSIFATGSSINIQQIGVGQVTLAQGAGVTITSTGATASAPKLRSQYSAATIICTASNTFTVIGDLS